MSDAAAAAAAAVTGAALGSMQDAADVLEKCLVGDVPEANALPQLQHIYGQSPQSVVKALQEKMDAVIYHAHNRKFSARAGTILMNAAVALDGRHSLGPAVGGSGDAHVVTRGLLEHLLSASGGMERGPKEPVIRGQICAFVTTLAATVPGHKGALRKLLRYAADKVPSVREKAARGLAAMNQCPEVERALAHLTTDLCTAVRASAVHALRVTSVTAPALLARVDDVEVCVRVQLFNTLANQPAEVDKFGPASLAHLVVGLVDRSPAVRAAAATTVDAWREHLGSALNLIARCNVTDDEALGEAIGNALATRYPVEGAVVARGWLRSGGNKERVNAAANAPGAIFARFALTSMSEEARDDVLDVPALVARTREVLEMAPTMWRDDEKNHWMDFLLRQLLHVVVIADVCDEATRREVEQLAETVLLRAPIPTSTGVTAAKVGRQPFSAIDLAVIILRQCSGLSQSAQARTRKHQIMENTFSKQMVLLISDLCQPYEGGGEGEASFAGRLSRQLHQLKVAIDNLTEQKTSLEAKKKKAIADEDFMLCHELKEQFKRNGAEMAAFQEKASMLEVERDGVCLRVTAMITALLRWSSSNLRMDPALFGTLQTILQPMVSLPALSETVDIAAITAICLFCTRDGATARMHWSLLLQLVRNLRDGSGNKQLIRARAAVAARTLSDCARIHGESGQLDRDEVIGAALSLASVPFPARHIVLEPLCGWLLSLGHIFFEEHLLEPVLEVQWALGWMLVETFRQRSNSSQIAAGKSLEEGEENADGDNEIDTVMSMQLMQFFSLLPKLPGKQGAPMLSLAVESVAENGLWRRAVLQPASISFHTRFVRTFSWPMIFTFAHERSPVEMRFRLWKCALQLCVTYPTLAPFAEVPIALANVLSKNEAPPGAAELVQEAIRLGADADHLKPLQDRLPAVPETASGASWLLPRAEAEAADEARREALLSIGVTDLELWAPGSMGLPEVMPTHHKMRQVGRNAGARSQRGGGSIPSTPQTSIAATPTPLRVEAVVAPLAPPATPETVARTPAEATARAEVPAEEAGRPLAPQTRHNQKAAATTKPPQSQNLKGHKQKTVDSMPPPSTAPEAKRRRQRSKTTEGEGNENVAPQGMLKELPR